MNTSRNSIAVQCIVFASNALGHDTPYGKELSALRDRLHIDTGDHTFSDHAPMDRDTLEAIQNMLDLELAFIDRCDQHDAAYMESDPTLWSSGYLETLPQTRGEK
ncbi:MAG: hypothetical protein EOM37_13430 [Proteobacteria bacterium]|nr:hypothetical protein [Pseudomonadota bacterium]